MKCFLSCNDESLRIEIVKDSYTKTEVYYSNLNQADNSSRFNVIFTIELANFLKVHINDDVKAEIYNDDLSQILFTGFLRKSQTFQKTQKNQPVSLELVSPSYFLNKTSIRGRGYVNKSLSYIITDLLNEAGFTDVGDLSALTYTPMVLVFKSGDNFKTVISQILQEYGYVFDFDNRGFFQVYPIFNNPVKENIEQLFNGINCLSKIEIVAKEHEADSVSAEWKKVSKHLNTLIFKDTTNADDTHDCKQPVLAGEYFANEKFNYLDCDSEFGDVVFIEKVYPDVAADSQKITYQMSETDLAPDRLGEVLGTQLCFKAYNSDSSDHNLIRIQANADVYTSENVVEVRSFGNKNRKSLTLGYVYDQNHAESFVENYTNWLRYATDTIKLESKTDYSLGSFVKVEDYGIGTYYGRILKKITSLKNDVIQYEIETIAEFTPATMDYKQNPSAGKITQNSIDAALKQSKDYTDESITSVVVDVASRWEIRPNTFILRKNGEGSFESDLVTAEAVQITGDLDSRSYAGYWKNTVTFTDGTSRVIYDGTEPESTYTYHAPENASKVTLELYTKRSTDVKAVMLDRQFIQVVKDGSEGLLVFLNDTFQTYKADNNGNLKDVPEFTTQVSCYIGSEEASCVIDLKKMKELNGTIRGLDYTARTPNVLRVKPQNGNQLRMGGTIIVPVVVDSAAYTLYSYGYADENGHVYAGADIEPGSNTILLKWNWQKLNILEATNEVILESIPTYFGKVTSFETIPTVGKNGDYFLYAGEESELHNFRIGHFYLYQNGYWVEKSTTSIKEMDDVFNDMISIVDISDTDAPMVTIVNRLVTSDAFIDKLATRIISLQNGGLLKSSNYDGTMQWVDDFYFDDVTISTCDYFIYAGEVYVFTNGTEKVYQKRNPNTIPSLIYEYTQEESGRYSLVQDNVNGVITLTDSEGNTRLIQFDIGDWYKDYRQNNLIIQWYGTGFYPSVDSSLAYPKRITCYKSDYSGYRLDLNGTKGFAVDTFGRQDVVDGSIKGVLNIPSVFGGYMKSYGGLRGYAKFKWDITTNKVVVDHKTKNIGEIKRLCKGTYAIECLETSSLFSFAMGFAVESDIADTTDSSTKYSWTDSAGKVHTYSSCYGDWGAIVMDIKHNMMDSDYKNWLIIKCVHSRKTRDIYETTVSDLFDPIITSDLFLLS